jgi:hypothetical protein
MRHLGKVQAFLAFAVCVGFFAALWLVLKNDVDSSMRDALLILIGNLATCFGAIVNYYFGSSSGSQQKTELLGNKPTEPQ